MSTPEVDQAQALLQPLEDDIEYQNERQGADGDNNSIDIQRVVNNVTQSKAFDILKSALKIFTSNTKLMFFMLLSVIPFFVFLGFFEIKVQKTVAAAPSALRYPLRVVYVSTVYLGNRSRSAMPISITQTSHESQDDVRMEFVSNFLQVCVLYLVVYPLLDLVSMITTVQIATKVHAGEKPATLKDVFQRKSNFKGVLVTCGCVQLLSFLTFLGLIWIVMNHLCFGKFGDPTALFWQINIDTGICFYLLLLGIHTVMFVALLYKYLHWSAFWNMSLVISVLEDETGLDAFGMTGYYGKHCRPTGFQLMLVFVGYNIVLRLPYLYGGVSNSSVAATSVVTALVCVGGLVKWVAFVLYYFDCKQQTMEKKNDEEIGKNTA